MSTFCHRIKTHFLFVCLFFINIFCERLYTTCTDNCGFPKVTCIDQIPWTFAKVSVWKVKNMTPHWRNIFISPTQKKHRKANNVLTNDHVWWVSSWSKSTLNFQCFKNILAATYTHTRAHMHACPHARTHTRTDTHKASGKDMIRQASATKADICFSIKDKLHVHWG